MTSYVQDVWGLVTLLTRGLIIIYCYLTMMKQRMGLDGVSVIRTVNQERFGERFVLDSVLKKI
jgi:hypothetical protein